MDTVLQQLLTLTREGTTERRCASLVVLGALKLQNSRIMESVAAALGDSNVVLKDYALRYFEEAQPKVGISLLLPLLDDPNKEIQARVVRLLVEASQAAVRPVLQHAPTASRLWQLNAARVLCAAGGKAALRGLLQLLLSGTNEFNRAVCDLMIPTIRDMDPKQRDLFYDQVEAFAADLDVRQQHPAVISAIRLLGQLGRPQARRWLFGFVEPGHDPSLRSHALAALLHCLREQELRKDEYSRLFSVLEEAEFSEVTRLAVELLDAHPLPEDSRPLLSRLLESPHGTVQKFALRRMGEFSSPATVRTLVQQLGDADYRRRDIAVLSLHKIPEARAALIKELLSCDDPSKAWSIAETLPSYEGKWRRDILEAIWKRLRSAISAEDRIQTAFMHVLKKASPDYAHAQLAAHGVRLFKAKKYKEALSFLTPLKDSSEFRAEHKLHLALTQLKLRPHAVVAASHRHEPALDLISDLYRTSTFPLFQALKKEKALSPEDLFHLGFSLVERPGDERTLGRDILEHLVARFPRTKVGKGAKNKLKLLSW